MFSMFVDAVWKVAVAGVILGAGLPALFAVGVRSVAVGNGAVTSADAGPRSGYRALGLLCFVVCAVLIALGLLEIIAAGLGKSVTFTHVFPTLIPKS